MPKGAEFSFETLTHDAVGRRLISGDGRFEVAAKMITTDQGEFLSVRVWIGSAPTDGGDGWSEPSTWSHTIYDDDHDIVAVGFGSRERESWAAAERMLQRKLRISDAKSERAVPIEDLELGVVAFNCLRRVGVETVGGLIDKSPAQLKGIPNLGEAQLAEIEEALVDAA